MHRVLPSGRSPSLTARNGVRLSAPSAKQADATFSADASSGVFEGYASLFGVMDLARDIVMPGAFRDSLVARGAGGVRMLWQHQPSEIVGAWTTIEEDQLGLHVRGMLDLDQPRARAALSLMRKGALDGLSIGYRCEAERRDRETGLRRLERIDLWEISLVTFPLLPQARIRSVKAAPTPPGSAPALRRHSAAFSERTA